MKINPSKTLAHLRNDANNVSMNGTEFLGQCTGELSRLASPDLFKILSDPTRLAVLIRLAASPSPLTVSEASQCCGVHLSGVSRHLKALKDAGLAEAAKQGREVVYRPRLSELVATLRGMADAIESFALSGECCRLQGENHEGKQCPPGGSPGVRQGDHLG
jgi:DNA-binding transcriptional ArsR family regulator